ncbi:uncharacterized protein tti2 isoform X2 [Xiphias gladius]|uniref:uncharacterized protein tti2 isoform X2 n=1 Tax=Xiphias gladius TaxID=8245 RepID=UPI001A9960F1|nr:uncharacterized protein tti2 isoform X2 [Xiphias gladius]
MELSSLLHDLRLSSSEKPLPSAPLPPITELLSRLQEKLTGASSDSKTSSPIGCVERLFETADPDWLFSLASANDEDGRAELRSAYRSLIDALIGCAALPLCEDDCGSLTAAACRSVPDRAIPVCSALRALLGALGTRERTGLLLTVAPPVCVFAVTHFQDQVWTTSSSRAAAQILQEALLRAGGWRDSAHLLMGDRSWGEEGEGGESRGILGGVLDFLQPQLTKDSWQRCEAVKLVFAWTLLQVTRPSLSPHLPRFLPPSLLLIDHYRPENCMLGVRCLHHIVLNTPDADLRQFNRAEVLYQALFKHLYTTEAAVIQPVLSCLLDLLLVLEKPPSSLAPSSARRKPCRHDDVLRLVLTHMEAEHKDGRGGVQTPAAGGAGGAGIPGDQRSTRRDEQTEDPGGAAEDHQSRLATDGAPRQRVAVLLVAVAGRRFFGLSARRSGQAAADEPNHALYQAAGRLLTRKTTASPPAGRQQLLQPRGSR